MPDSDEPVSYDESLRLLREFLRQVEKLLADIEAHPRPAIPGRHHAKLSAAWKEVQPKFKPAIDQLSSPRASNIKPILADSGLTGRQLIFKLSIFQHAHDELIDHGTPEHGQQKGRRWWRRWLDLLKPVLQAADVILDSLAKVIPAVEAIKEYKEAVESGTKLGAEAAKK